MIIAVDKGTTYTKTENILFKSTIREYKNDEIDFSQNKIIVQYNNKKYVVGEKGKTNTDLFKSQQSETKLLILTAIALSNPYQIKQNITLVTGLPIGRYATEKNQMKQLFEHTSNTIIINDRQYNINIQQVEVFPEGASSFYYINIDNGLIIDIGGLSVDVALFNENKILTKYSTHKLGIMPLYRQIANKINNKYSLSRDEWDIENIINNELTINGKSVKLDIDDLVNEHIQRILQSLEFEYDMPIIKNIYLTGGGGSFLYPYFKKKIQRVQLMPNAQYTNVNTYKILGEVLFYEES